jgi:hypothetical protein
MVLTYFFFAGPKIRLDKPTSYPILFTSNTIDPITPLRSYVLSICFVAEDFNY